MAGKLRSAGPADIAMEIEIRVRLAAVEIVLGIEPGSIARSMYVGSGPLG